MPSLADQSLEPCTNSSTALTNEGINQYLTQLDNWQVNNEKDTIQITKIFVIKNYTRALTFTNNIAELAEQENHHPKICIEWGKVTVSWWTHTLNGLFINDFIMAARCDDLFAE